MLTTVLVLLVLVFVAVLLLVPAFLFFHLWARSQDLEQLKFFMEMLESQNDFDLDFDDDPPPPPPHTEIPDQEGDDDIPL